MKLTTEQKTELKPIIIRFAYFVLGAILVFLYMRNCEGKTTVIGKTPVLSGTFKHDTVTKIEYQQIKVKGDQIIKYVPTIREVVVNKNDTAYIAYGKDTIRTQSFTKRFENDTLRLEIFGTVTGRIDSLNAKWLIKPISVPIKYLNSRDGVLVYLLVIRLQESLILELG